MTAPVQEGRGAGSVQVLLVAANGASVETIVDVLEADNIRVAVCDPSAVLEQIILQQPDLLLHLPAWLPGGVELVEAVRAHPGMMALPVIVIGTDGEGDDGGIKGATVDRYRLIAAGADEVLGPSLSPEILCAAVRSRISRARMLEGSPESEARNAPRRSGQLRRGQFLAQLSGVLRDAGDAWQVLLALRVDQAKMLGETLGQASAFDLEQMIAARIAPVLEQHDAYTLWMEFGFGVLARREARVDVESLARDLCARVAAENFVVGDVPFALTASVGVALPPGGTDTGNADRWFASAYAAQAIAHRLGGNRFDGVLSRDHGSMAPERVLIIREWVKEAVTGDNVLIEFQPVLPLQAGLSGLYSLQAKLRDYRAPLTGVNRKEYLSLARDAGALPMIDRMSLFSAFEAIEQERARGRTTQVMVAMDLATITDAQLVWLDAELRRRKSHSDGLIIEFDADSALGRPELVRVVQRLEDQGVIIAVADESGRLDRILALQRFPAGMLRLPMSTIDSVPPAEFVSLLGPWTASGRVVVADHVQDIGSVSRLFDMRIGYVQAEALAASGTRLDYEFTQFGV